MDIKKYIAEYERLYAAIRKHIGNERAINELIVEMIGPRPDPIPDDKTFRYVESRRVGYMKYDKPSPGFMTYGKRKTPPVRRVTFGLDGFALTDNNQYKEMNVSLLREISDEFAKAASFIEGKDV